MGWVDLPGIVSPLLSFELELFLDEIRRPQRSLVGGGWRSGVIQNIYIKREREEAYRATIKSTSVHLVIFKRVETKPFAFSAPRNGM